MPLKGGSDVKVTPLIKDDSAYFAVSAERVERCSHDDAVQSVAQAPGQSGAACRRQVRSTCDDRSYQLQPAEPCVMLPSECICRWSCRG